LWVVKFLQITNGYCVQIGVELASHNYI
jgi:hypothetical protein